MNCVTIGNSDQMMEYDADSLTSDNFPASMNPMKLSRLIAIVCTAALSASSYSQSQSQVQDQQYSPFHTIERNTFIRGTPAASQSPTQRANQNSPSARGCGSGTLAWGSNNYDDVPGIQWAYIASYCDSGKEIAIWTDFTTSMFGSNAIARSQGREIIANDGSQHSDSNGNRTIIGFIEANAKVEYSFSVDSVGSQYGYINGRRYDLKEGTLFLVASSRTEIEVKQVSYNLADISATDIALLATRLPDITDFYELYHLSKK